MENENIEKIMGELYQSAPKEVQEALNSVELADEIQEIGNKHQIHIDKLGHLYDEVTMVMLGLEEPSELKESLERKLGLSEEKIIEIVKDINEKVFEPIRESLKKLYPVEESSSEVPMSNIQYPKNEQGDSKPKTQEVQKFKKKELHIVENSEVQKFRSLEVQKKDSKNIVENKLNETIKTEVENIPVNEDEEKEKESETKNYTIDPYKEPLE